LDFMGFSFSTSKSKNDISYIEYWFHIDLGRFVGDWTCIIEILKYLYF
jgi:hypothetical protein